jgi:lauroyl/myristoyl acyltransferase
MIGGLAWLNYPVSRENKRMMRSRIAQAFDGRLSQEQIESIVRQSFWEKWREAFSLLPSAWDQALARDARVQGLEHLEQALQAGKGAILWESSTFGSRNLSKRILRARRLAIHQIHGDDHLGWSVYPEQAPMTWVRQRVVTPFFHRKLAGLVSEVIWLPRSGSLAFVRKLCDRLKENTILCSAADGSYGLGFVDVSFLGQSHAFATGMANLARTTGAPLLPMFCLQDGIGKATVIIHAPITCPDDADRESAVRACIGQWVELMESYVRAYPAKYWG